MNQLVEYKNKLLSMIPSQSNAVPVVLSILREGRISDKEAETILNALQSKGQVINLTIDNSVEISGTHWGEIATGNSEITGGYFSDRKL